MILANVLRTWLVRFALILVSVVELFVAVEATGENFFEIFNGGRGRT